MIAFACTKDKSAVYGDYPKEVGKLIITKCATSGCHDNQSYLAAGSLNLSTWNKLFEGSPIGAAIIAGRADLSSLCYFINAQTNNEKLDPELPSVNPIMPYNRAKLNVFEYNTIKNWINSGALNDKGERRFNSENVVRKYYITNQGCDEVCVMDAKTTLPINYIKVGVSSSPELPHMIRVSPDGKYWYVCFIGNQNTTVKSPSNIFQKYDAVTDQLIATCNLTNTNGSPITESTSWNTFAIRPDGKEACVSDLSSGILVRVDLETMKVKQTYGTGLEYDNSIKLHGTFYNANGSVIYATNQNSDQVIKFFIDTNGNGRELVTINNDNSSAQPHEIIFSPNGKYYFITCQGYSNKNARYEVSVVNTSNDSIIKLIPTGVSPQEMAMSKKRNLLFVTCTEDNASAAPGTKGVITVIDMNTLTVVKTITDVGYQPHGIAIDDVNDRIIVANRNANVSGPAPHHASSCGGRNGFVTIFDLNTFEKIKKRIELLPDPYSVAIKN